MDQIKPYVIGVDLGGTNTVFGIVNDRGEVVSDNSIRTQEYATIGEFVDASCASLKPLIEGVGGIEKINGIGIGAPNGNYYKGTIEFAPNLPWKGVVHLADLFQEKLGIPVAVTNDANAAALGEYWFGPAGRPSGRAGRYVHDGVYRVADDQSHRRADGHAERI